MTEIKRFSLTLEKGFETRRSSNLDFKHDYKSNQLNIEKSKIFSKLSPEKEQKIFGFHKSSEDYKKDILKINNKVNSFVNDNNYKLKSLQIKFILEKIKQINSHKHENSIENSSLGDCSLILNIPQNKAMIRNNESIEEFNSISNSNIVEKISLKKNRLRTIPTSICNW